MRIIDLSQEISEDIPVYPTLPKPKIFNWSVPHGAFLRSQKGDTKGHEAALSAIFMSDHHGTHVDSLYHYNPGAAKIHEMPLNLFFTEAVVLNLTHKGAGTFITETDLEAALKKSGETINPGDGLLLFTGWDKKWGNAGEYLNNPGISMGAAKWVLDKKVRIIGIDAASLDVSDRVDTVKPAHKVLIAEHGITHYENLCNMDKILKPRVMFIGLPIKIRGTTAAPVRAIAIEDFPKAHMTWVT